METQNLNLEALIYEAKLRELHEIELMEWSLDELDSYVDALLA